MQGQSWWCAGGSKRYKTSGLFKVCLFCLYLTSIFPEFCKVLHTKNKNKNSRLICSATEPFPSIGTVGLTSCWRSQLLQLFNLLSARECIHNGANEAPKAPKTMRECIEDIDGLRTCIPSQPIKCPAEYHESDAKTRRPGRIRTWCRPKPCISCMPGLTPIVAKFHHFSTTLSEFIQKKNKMQSETAYFVPVPTPGELEETCACASALIILTDWFRYIKTRRHPQNRKYVTYCNAVREGRSHGHRWQLTCTENLVKFERAVFDMRVDRQTNKQTYRHADRNTSHWCVTDGRPKIRTEWNQSVAYTAL